MDERGSVLVVALLILLALSLLGVAGISTSTTELQIAGNQYRGVQAIYAADAGSEFLIRQLLPAGPGAALAIVSQGIPSVNWTNVPLSNPYLGSQDQFRVVDTTGALKNPAVGAGDLRRVVIGSALSESSGQEFKRITFNVGYVEGRIPSLDISRRIGLEMSFPQQTSSGGGPLEH